MSAPLIDPLKHLACTLLPGVVSASVLILGVRIGRRRRRELEIHFIPTNEIPFHAAPTPAVQRTAGIGIRHSA